MLNTTSKLNPDSAFVLPRLDHGRDDFTIIKEQRMKHRLEEINSIIKTQNYYDWLAEQKEQNSRSQATADPLWWRSQPCTHSASANATTALYAWTISLKMRKFVVFDARMPSTRIA